MFNIIKNLSPKYKTTLNLVGLSFASLLIFFACYQTIAFAQSDGNYCEERYGTEDLNACYRILWSQGILFVDPMGVLGGGSVTGSEQCIGKALPTINDKSGFVSAINKYIDDYVGPNRTSPFQGQGEAFVEGGISTNLNPMLAVAHLKMESGLLANGVSSGWAGNTYATEEGALNQDQSQRVPSYNAFGRSAGDSQPHVYYKTTTATRKVYQWSSWADSLSGPDNWFELIKRRYADLPPADLTAHIMRYAPPSDGNDVVGYVESIVKTMTDIIALSGSSLGCGGDGTTGAAIADFTGPITPCEGQPKEVVRKNTGVDWSGITPTGTIGTDKKLNVYVRDACSGQTNVRTIVIGASIHASENGGQVVAHELLFNKQIPSDVRIIAIPEINVDGLTGNSPRPRVNKNSVNLNRNFDYNWDSAKQGEADDGNDNFKGPSPASELETQAIQNFLLNLGKTSAIFSYHRCLNVVFSSGPDQTLSKPIASRYASLIPNSTTTCNGKPYSWRAATNSGPGFFEAWYNAKTGTPALLVELSSATDFSYLDKHADTIVNLLNENVIKAVDGSPVVSNTTPSTSQGSSGPVIYTPQTNLIPGVANVGDRKMTQIPTNAVTDVTCPTKPPQWTGTNKLRTDIGIMFEGSTVNQYYNTRTCSGGDIHKEGRASDVYARVDEGQTEKGNSMFEWLLSNADLIGIQYIKYWKVEWAPTIGIRCVNTVEQRNSHSTHIHYELNWDGAKSQTPYFVSGQKRDSFISINQDICPALDPNNPNQEIR